MADKVMPLTAAVEGYELFDKMKVQKGAIIHDPSPCSLTFLFLMILIVTIVFEAQK